MITTVEVPKDFLMELLEEEGIPVYSMSWDSGGPMTGTVSVWAFREHFFMHEDASGMVDSLRAESVHAALDHWDLWSVGDADVSLSVELPDEELLARLKPLEEAEGEWVTEVNGRPFHFPSKTPVDAPE